MTLRLTYSSSRLFNALREPTNMHSLALNLRSSQFSLLHTALRPIRSKPSFCSNAWRTTGAVAVATIGIGLAGISKPALMCDTTTHQPIAAGSAPPQSTPSPPENNELPPPPKSAVNVYELSFGTVCGLCSGVFVKKGIKAAAFLLGGVFVLLQYLGSRSVVRVDWGRVATRFEDMFYTTDGQGIRRAPNVVSLWRWMVDFLTADFQPRASFIAGFALGLRIG